MLYLIRRDVNIFSFFSYNVTGESMKKIKGFIIRLLIAVIFVLSISIGVKKSTSFKTNFYKNVYENNISFGYLNTLYTKYLGPILPFKLDLNQTPVFSEKLTYKSKNKYMDGVELEVETNYLVPSLDAGLVVFVGEKEGYGNTIIIEEESGNEVWYGNLDNLNVELYDYIETGTYLGDTTNNKLYLVFKKDGNILNYEEYLS